MINLIKNEIIKIFSKKSTYILLLIFMLFVIFTNVIYKSDYINQDKYEYSEIKELENEDMSILDLTNKYSNVNNNTKILINFFNEYEMLIIIFLIIISSSIITEEYTKNTIKQLLICPYTRIEILLSKIITMFILILFIFLYLLLIQLFIGTIFFGLNISNKVIVYDYSIKQLLEINIFKYLFIIFFNKLPQFLITVSISLFFGVIFTNNVLTITSNLLLNLILFPIINSFTIGINYVEKLKFLRFFISPNTDLTIYIFNKPSINSLMNYSFSITIFLIYLMILLILSLIIFKYKDIKNT